MVHASCNLQDGPFAMSAGMTIPFKRVRTDPEPLGRLDEGPGRPFTILSSPRPAVFRKLQDRDFLAAGGGCTRRAGFENRAIHPRRRFLGRGTSVLGRAGRPGHFPRAWGWSVVKKVGQGSKVGAAGPPAWVILNPAQCTRTKADFFTTDIPMLVELSGRRTAKNAVRGRDRLRGDRPVFSKPAGRVQPPAGRGGSPRSWSS